ncbi:hypothetical protein [Brevundimonas sp.]|uniref:hypothetical protein n=1 Tax=Brevundimonas sp. TaxID=1871086 RepID=UPI0025DA9361|nr:hypothetical protein [Brevundimonas sp.]
MPGADAFDEEMEELRRELGHFVLELLKTGESDRIVGQLGKELASEVSRRSLTVTLAAQDRQLLEALLREARQARSGAMRRDDAGAADGEPRGRNLVPEQASDGPGFAVAPDPRGPGPAMPWLGRPDMLPWALCVVFLVLLIAVSAYTLFRPAPAAEGQPPPVQTQSLDPETAWSDVVQTVETWPAEERLAARRTLCGEIGAEEDCPSWAERSEDLLDDPAGRAAVADVIARARCAEATTEAEGAEPGLDPSCILMAAP